MQLRSLNNLRSKRRRGATHWIEARRAGRLGGFTLLELLLSIVILLLLFAAVAFSFRTLTHGAALDEGVNRLESLIRYLQAEAANRGRRLQLVFEGEGSSTSTNAPVATKRLYLRWEADPFQAPGLFRELDQYDWMADAVNELLVIESMRAGEKAPLKEPSLEDWDSEAADQHEEEGIVMFYPDGSSDSAEFILVSLDAEDQRKIRFEITGLTGVISHRLVTPEEDDSFFEDFWEEAEPEESVPAEKSRGRTE